MFGVGDNLPVTTVTTAWAFALDVDLGAVWCLSSAPVWGLKGVEYNAKIFNKTNVFDSIHRRMNAKANCSCSQESIHSFQIASSLIIDIWCVALAIQIDEGLPAAKLI